MLNFVSNFFKGRDRAAAQQHQVVAPVIAQNSNKIKYDDNLIEDLKADHNSLVNLYGQIWTAYELQNYEKMASLVSDLKRSFQAHILKENVKFYVYLEQSLEQDAHTLEIVKEFRSDMNGIANTVVKFCKRYGVRNLNPSTTANFEAEYKAIGEALTKRVQLEEEDLYTLYHA